MINHYYSNVGCKGVGLVLSGKNPDLSLLISNNTPLPTFGLAYIPLDIDSSSQSSSMAGGFGGGGEGDEYLKIEVDDSLTEGEGMNAFVKVFIFEA